MTCSALLAAGLEQLAPRTVSATCLLSTRQRHEHEHRVVLATTLPRARTAAAAVHIFWSDTRAHPIPNRGAPHEQSKQPQQQQEHALEWINKNEDRLPIYDRLYAETDRPIQYNFPILDRRPVFFGIVMNINGEAIFIVVGSCCMGGGTGARVFRKQSTSVPTNANDNTMPSDNPVFRMCTVARHANDTPSDNPVF